jgi:hypothetical protein
MDEYFKKEDEITLAGIARQDVELYGEKLRRQRSIWYRLKVAIRSVFNPSDVAKSEEPDPPTNV